MSGECVFCRHYDPYIWQRVTPRSCSFHTKYYTLGFHYNSVEEA